MRTQSVIDRYRKFYYDECAPLGLRCETCDNNWCGCPVTPLPTTYDCLSARYRFFASDPNMPVGFHDKSTGGWYMATQRDGVTKYVKAEKETNDYTYLEADPDYDAHARRGDRGPGYYRLVSGGRYGNWNMKPGKK